MLVVLDTRATPITYDHIYPNNLKDIKHWHCKKYINLSEIRKWVLIYNLLLSLFKIRKRL